MRNRKRKMIWFQCIHLSSKLRSFLFSHIVNSKLLFHAFHIHFSSQPFLTSHPSVFSTLLFLLHAILSPLSQTFSIPNHSFQNNPSFQALLTPPPYSFSSPTSPTAQTYAGICSSVTLLVSRWMDGWMDGWMDDEVDGWKMRWMDE